MMSAQIHMEVGTLNVWDREDGDPVTWSIGYGQEIVHGFILDAQIRYTGILWDTYYSPELYLKQRMDIGDFMVEPGVGMGYNLDDWDIYPIIDTRLGVDIDDGIYIIGTVVQTFRDKKETYFTVGIMFRRPFMKGKRQPKRFF
jgi:hypothetical protein